MNISNDQVQGRVPVSILRLTGDLDAISYRDLIAAARAAHAAGARQLLIDMRATLFMGSSGLVALHSIALLFAGQPPPESEAGWRALHAVGEVAEGGQQHVVKLLGPSPQVERVLDKSGLKQFFEIYVEQQPAVDSF